MSEQLSIVPVDKKKTALTIEDEEYFKQQAKANLEEEKEAMQMAFEDEVPYHEQERIYRRFTQDIHRSEEENRVH